MKTTTPFKIFLMAFASSLLFACSSGKMSGSASDRTGANGATNGTGKVPSGTAHDQKN